MIGLDDLLSVYCTPEKEFNFDAFKTELLDWELNTLHIRKIFRVFEAWRDEACICTPSEVSSSSPPSNSSHASATPFSLLSELC